MYNAGVKITRKSNPKAHKILNAIAKSANLRMSVGFVNKDVYPAESPNKDYFDFGGIMIEGEPVAQVAYKQEFGQVKKNVVVPPRPFMRPVAAKTSVLSRIFKKAFKDALKNDSGHLRRAMKKCGTAVKKEIKSSIMKVSSPPLAEKTLELRRERGNYSDKPLVDTGLMLKSVAVKLEDM